MIGSLTSDGQPLHSSSSRLSSFCKTPRTTTVLPLVVTGPKEMLILPVVSRVFFFFFPILNSNKKVPWIFFLSNIISVSSVQFSHSVMSQLFATPWTLAHQDSLSITTSWGFITLMSIESVMPSNRLILCCPLFLPSVFPRIRVFSNESVLCIRWPKY